MHMLRYWGRGLNFGLRLPLLPYFMYVRSKGSGDTAHLHRLVTDAFNTNILYVGPYILKMTNFIHTNNKIIICYHIGFGLSMHPSIQKMFKF